jgi:hypothetical protein
VKRHNKGDRLSHGDANRYEQHYDWWRRNKAYGEGGGNPLSPVNFSKVMAANFTGQQIYIGDVCEFDGNPFPDVDPAENYPDPRNDRWLKAVVPNGERIGWGIALDPIGPATGVDREGGWFLTLGVCHAIVKIVDNDHKYAEREAGEQVLRSAAKGPVKILHKPTGGSLPERRLCLVQLMDESGDTVEVVEVHHPSPAVDGQIVAADASGYHQARLRIPNGTTTYTIGEEVWLQFAEGHDGYPDQDGQVLAVQGENYFAKDTGRTWGESENERPLYVAICDERSFIGVTASPIARFATGTIALLHSHNFESAEITKTGKALQDIPPSVLVKITRRAGVWMIELLDKTLVHFELIDELSLTGTGSGHAKAKLLAWNGSAWAAGDPAVEIEVFDWFGGMWNGLAGYRGWAEYRPTQYTDPGEDEEDEEDDVLRTAFEIIWMERPAQLIRFISTAAMSGGELSVTVSWYDWQGRDPGSSVIVYDPQDRYPDVHAGASGVAYYNNKDKRYEILDCQRIVQFAEAILTADCCGSSASIGTFTAKACGEYVGDPPTDPTSATNPCGHAGVSGSVVNLRRISNSMTWEVIDILKVVVPVVIGVQISGTTFQLKTADCYLERCEAGDNGWETWHTGEVECP